MKDAFGHGSNGKGNNSALTKTQGPASPMPRGPSGHGVKHMSGGGVSNAPNPTQIHGGVPISSNAQAARTLMSALKSTQAPIHPAMQHQSANSGSSS